MNEILQNDTSSYKKKKPRVVACLACRKNHKKCDGNRPCGLCVTKNRECLENNKRKAVGRPKITEEEKKNQKKKNKMRCGKCKSVQEIKAKFW